MTRQRALFGAAATAIFIINHSLPLYDPVNYSPTADLERPMKQTGGLNLTPLEDSAPAPL